ncbi:EamA family transporter [Azospirillum melinis]|uniref:EamA family transporter n=1 Tax=Azospirillum melinis TaxID=328839 RepID=A0ABX2KL01_9PROT|nr:DMT family transporter [Azospirillum melinis]MBP2307489.1 drug/metabolite transporter (DMT)-like permease [Azospirillum melinis]NUB01934.1 EamA family transporter [Azospirillum melinis]
MGHATKGALWTLASAFSFMAANLLIKHLSAKLPALEMALFRSAGGLILVVVAWRAFLHLRQLQDPQGHLIRAAVGAVSLMALVHAYSSPALPVALVTAFMYTRVLLVIPMQRVFLGERAGRRVWIAAGIGIVGALVALWPRLMAIGTPHWDWAVASLVIAAFAGAGSQIAMRRLARTNPASVVVAVAAILVSAIVAVPASSVMVEPPADDLPWLAGIAVLSACAQWSTVRSYKHASPAVLMPITLIDVPVALSAGYLLFGEMPGVNAVVGAVIIIAAAAYVTSMTDARPRRIRVAA